ncbi:homing endonuclease associated repeat-containing protein [Salinirussus salinus]|uniref:homing endonuclease associated repeat-containing protein n=1 Tax=Salinirussus salinus TaxID=1198300 RepID=UPI00135CECF8|nr:HNH endonuclease [Salinirussus salinus]
MATEEDCLAALRAAARELGESPTKAQYEDLGLTPAASTILRVCGGWNEAKERAGLETYDAGQFGGTEVGPKPDHVDLTDEEWEALSGHQRWYRKNLDHSRERKRRRRRELVRWVYEYKRDNCECRECGEEHPGCLEFHHPDGTDKEFSVSRRANRGHSKENIRAEMERCVVLCANCHRKEHYEPPTRPESDRV